jgi:hypothetical protein
LAHKDRQALLVQLEPLELLVLLAQLVPLELKEILAQLVPLVRQVLKV